MLLRQKPCHYNGNYMHANGFAVLAEGLHMVIVSFCYKWQLVSFFLSLSIYLITYVFYSFISGGCMAIWGLGPKWHNYIG
jgi:hypothetical protein